MPPCACRTTPGRAPELLQGGPPLRPADPGIWRPRQGPEGERHVAGRAEGPLGLGALFQDRPRAGPFAASVSKGALSGQQPCPQVGVFSRRRRGRERQHGVAADPFADLVPRSYREKRSHGIEHVLQDRQSPLPCGPIPGCKDVVELGIDLLQRLLVAAPDPWFPSGDEVRVPCRVSTKGTSRFVGPSGQLLAEEGPQKLVHEVPAWTRSGSTTGLSTAKEGRDPSPPLRQPPHG